MTIFKELNDKLNDFLNQNLNTVLFDLQYINNAEQYNVENLVFDDTIHGVTSVIAETISPDDASSKTITIQAHVLIPLENKNYTIAVNSIDNLLQALNNAEISLSEKVIVTNPQRLVDGLYPGLIRGNKYHEIKFTFACLFYPSYSWANNSILTIDDVVCGSKLNVTLSSHKQTDGKVFSNGIVKPQNNGVQIALSVDLIYNKKNTAHKKIINDYLQQATYQIVYRTDEMVFQETCKLIDYTLVSIAGDTVKLKVTFMRGD